MTERNRLAEAAAEQVLAELRAPRGSFGEYRTPARRRELMRNMRDAQALLIADAVVAQVSPSPFVVHTYQALARELATAAGSELLLAEEPDDAEEPHYADEDYELNPRWNEHLE